MAKKNLIPSAHNYVLVKMQKEHTLPYKVAVDVLGFLLIILSGLVGWLPGPGGLPIFLAGLALLAKNHSWAKNLLDTLKTKGSSIFKAFFKDHPILVVIYDIIVAFMLIFIIIWFYKTDNFRWLALIIMMLSLAVFIFFGNRNRYSTLKSKFKSLIK